MPNFLTEIGGSIVDGLEIYGSDGIEPGMPTSPIIPARRGQHLNDVDMYTPVYVDGRLVSFMAIRAHWADVDGKYTGSASSNDTTDIFQESVQFRTVKLRRRGEPVSEIYQMIHYNTRFPDMVVGMWKPSSPDA